MYMYYCIMPFIGQCSSYVDVLYCSKIFIPSYHIVSCKMQIDYCPQICQCFLVLEDIYSIHLIMLYLVHYIYRLLSPNMSIFSSVQRYLFHLIMLFLFHYINRLLSNNMLMFSSVHGRTFI